MNSFADWNLVHTVSHDGIQVALWLVHGPHTLHYMATIAGTGIMTARRVKSVRRTLAKACRWLVERDLDPDDVIIRIRR